MRVLVIGGTGFISGATVRALASEGHDVACFHRGGLAAGLPDGAEGIVGDRRRIADHRDALRAWRPDVVVDCVAFNEADTLSLQEALVGHTGRLVVLSSLDVYRAYGRFARTEPGPPDPLPLGEDAALRATRYPRRRWVSRDDVMWDYDKIPVEYATLASKALPGTVLRLPMVFGPGDHKRRRVGSCLDRMKTGRFALHPAFAAWRWTRCYVDDVARAIVSASTSPAAAGRVYNVGEDDPLTERAWVEAIARVAGWDGPIAEASDVSPEEDFTQHLVLDTTRIRADLGWQPVTSLEEALEASIAWEREVRQPS
jgi:nucleoside-diphosphate-sugar epimerase